MRVQRLLGIAIIIAAGAGGWWAGSATTTPLVARIVLSTTTVKAGNVISGSVIVDNDTGHSIHFTTCGGPFAVALENDEIKPEVTWAMCLQHGTLPQGRSVWPVRVWTRYSGCTNGPSTTTTTPRCTEGGPPLLPPGDYDAALFQQSHVVPTPPPVAVHVTA